MPDYLVTITLSGKSRGQIASYLETEFGSVVAAQAMINERKQANYCDKPCQTRGHFGCVHWTDDDLESRFAKLDIPATPELVKEVKDSILHIDDCMTELGWEVIEHAILESLDRLTKTAISSLEK
jgi:hypothetical protein